MWKEFEKFILRGNVIDMAVGIIIGAAFTTVVKSLVDDIIMPPIGLFTHGFDLGNWYINLGHEHYASLAEAQEAGAPTINIGLFISSVLSLIIVGLVVFFLIKGVNRMHDVLEELGIEEETPPEEPTIKTCPECFSEIPIQALRCAFCTIPLDVTGGSSAKGNPFPEGPRVRVDPGHDADGGADVLDCRSSAGSGSCGAVLCSLPSTCPAAMTRRRQHRGCE